MAPGVLTFGSFVDLGVGFLTIEYEKKEKRGRRRLADGLGHSLEDK